MKVVPAAGHNPPYTVVFPQSGVLQVKQAAWSSPSGAPGKQQTLSLGWHEF